MLARFLATCIGNEMAFDEKPGVWKKGTGKGKKLARGRLATDISLHNIQSLLAEKPIRRDLLIEYLHAIQDKYGYLGADNIAALSEIMKLSQAEIYEVASFYAHFDIVQDGQTPPPTVTIRVCDSLTCELNGGKNLLSNLKENYKNGEVRVIRAPCMGRCDTAPVLELGHNHIDNATLSKVQRAIKNKEFKPRIPNYQSLLEYLGKGGYAKYNKMKKNRLKPEDIEALITSSGLRGLGGAGFPSGKKWSFVRNASGSKYMAVNGDEGEPGTFKDRYYLERTPHLFLEGMLIAGWAVNVEKIYIYMRDEYPAVIKILQTEISNLEKQGIVQEKTIELRRGAGAYICGEESAMIESIEGKRGLPRHRPPYVAQAGLFGRPTLVHNIETLYWIARICYEGPEILSGVEKNGRKGLRSYSVSGRIQNPGVYLLPAGSTIRDIIQVAGGMLIGHTFKAYQPGGPSSGLLPAKVDNVPLDFDTLQEFGTFIGSAAVVILSDKDSVRAAALNMLYFFEDESCGQCTPCRVGCEKAVKLMKSPVWDRKLLNELCQIMTDSSICGLGQAAPNPILSTLKYFPGEVSK